MWGCIYVQFGKNDILPLILKAQPSETSNTPVLVDVVAFKYRLALILKYASWMAVRDPLSCTPAQIWMDSNWRNLKNILTVISTWTTSDPYWEQVPDNADHGILSEYLGFGLPKEFLERKVSGCHLVMMLAVRCLCENTWFSYCNWMFMCVQRGLIPPN